MPSRRSPRERSLSSARDFRTLRRRFSMRTPVWMRVIAMGCFVIVLPVYHGTLNGRRECGGVGDFVPSNVGGLRSSQGSSTTRADAFARSEREEKASAHFGRNDNVSAFALDGRCG